MNGGMTNWKDRDARLDMLINRNVEAAVFENDAAAILRDGLAYDRCTVGIVTDRDLVLAVMAGRK